MVFKKVIVFWINLYNYLIYYYDIIGLPDVVVFNKINSIHFINCNDLHKLLMDDKKIIIGTYIRIYKKSNGFIL